MDTPINAAAVGALAEEPLDWRFKALPASWWGHTPADVCAASPRLLEEGAVGPMCVLRADALAHNVAAMAQWCRQRGVELAPHGKTHMSPQLLARQLEAGACAVTVATVSQTRIFRAFGVTDVVLANELVDEAALRWLAAELDAHPDFTLVCWADSVRGVELMTSTLAAAGAVRPADVCVEVGMARGRTGCRGADAVDEVARAVVASPRLRLVGVAGYEAALGHDVTAEAVTHVRSYLADIRAAVLRLAPIFETDDVIATAGGSTYFDVVADELTGWPAGLRVRTVLRSGCYLTHDDGLYRRTSPLRDGLRPALSVWAQVVSRPEPDLAIVTMGRRDVSFDQDLPVPQGLPTARVVKLNDQHAYLRLGDERVEVGDWLEFGISHPCTVFDKWPMIPLLDGDGRVVDLIRTFF
ncbi:amino acid deaminase [Mycolicibacterium moriokaense]|uniref:Amino acid deaminase n=1 Tax=Mycolicibacterium moriokaense TaxID=39691 RepID=A0AAD1M5G7_9MYCO|nr:alanine racemase [Mycolicibacterium moriokaense]MCV7040185.1 alanine racemase [Mycolicibacterium moriokaense]ORB20095.1 amino acid deaminase [Mycolicibacterium moriokaense]BBX00199.1 amino acid deaminase [Mycolicibacterium moriokaense]